MKAANPDYKIGEIAKVIGGFIYFGELCLYVSQAMGQMWQELDEKAKVRSILVFFLACIQSIMSPSRLHMRRRLKLPRRNTLKRWLLMRPNDVHMVVSAPRLVQSIFFSTIT